MTDGFAPFLFLARYIGERLGEERRDAPGGGYEHVTFDKEGSDVARWLATQGIAGIVLKYRLPKTPGARRHHWQAGHGRVFPLQHPAFIGSQFIQA